MNDALIGHTGFVGSNLRAHGSYSGFYNSKNIGDIAGREYDCVVCSGVSAVKWMANKNPEQDSADIKILLDCLDQVRAERFVLISTVDVYQSPNGQTERDGRLVHGAACQRLPAMGGPRRLAIDGRNLVAGLDQRVQGWHRECRTAHKSQAHV